MVEHRHVITRCSVVITVDLREHIFATFLFTSLFD